jgi:hypothetical protein
MNIKKKRFVGLVIASLLCFTNLRASQDDYASGAIKTDYGFLLVWNGTNNYYTLEIKGKKVSQTSTERVQFSVDGMFLQIVNAPIKNFIEDGKRNQMDDRALLEAHRNWEVKYMEQDYKESLKVESSWEQMVYGKTALAWSIDVPAGAHSNVRKQTSLTLVKGDFILMLGSVATDTISEAASKQLLLKTAESLRTSDKPINLTKLQEQIRATSSVPSSTGYTSTVLGEETVKVIRTAYSGSLDDYTLIICTTKMQASLANDSDAGPFIRTMPKGRHSSGDRAGGGTFVWRVFRQRPASWHGCGEEWKEGQ